MDKNDPLTTQIGPYKIVSCIGKGGMGEVLLAIDPICRRKIALKKIRDDLKEHKILRDRFLREAYVTAALVHPGIVSIYSLHDKDENPYYTMPYLKGETLKEVLKRAHTPMQTNTPSSETSINALLPIFKSICQTILYAHSRGIIHRDLKPENVLVGEFGEVIILDWGLAQAVEGENDDALELITELPQQMTRPGKIVGTLSYMAPERAKGEKASILSDIYALGVMLYQILTLHTPFNRSSLASLKKNADKELLPDPEEIAPYRDVPPVLTALVKQCLESNPQKRLKSVEELIYRLTSHMEGRAIWFEVERLSVARGKDWEYQANVLIAKHMALTQATEAAEWVSLMLSKSPYAENVRIETNITLHKESDGIGFLISVPEAIERNEPFEGYCLWIGAEKMKGGHLYRNTVEVLHNQDLFLIPEKEHHLLFERNGNHIEVYLDGIKSLSYLSYLPLIGTHVGVLAKDDQFCLDEIVISVGSQNLQVSALAIPDAFLNCKDYPRALAEYRRIGTSFLGHAEGREALFRAGVTLLEQAKHQQKKELYTNALSEFEKLHKSPAAPLEYLGKSLVYTALSDSKEEINCLELGLRRYRNHPLIHPLQEQVIYRMHESSQNDRPSAYRLILIVLRHLSEAVAREDSKRLFEHLIKHWEVLPFLENPIDASMIGGQKNPNDEKLVEEHFAVPLAFWLSNPHSLVEIFKEAAMQKPLDPTLIGNLFFSLFELGSEKIALQLLQEVKAFKAKELEEVLKTLSFIELAYQGKMEEALEKAVTAPDVRAPLFLFQKALLDGHEKLIKKFTEPFLSQNLSRQDTIHFDSIRLFALLSHENVKEAEVIFESYPLELLNQESTYLHPLYGCFLLLTEGEEIANIHFSGVIDTAFPRSWALLSHFLIGNLNIWFDYAFLWEKRHLYRHLSLYYKCAGNQTESQKYLKLEKEQYVQL